MEIASKNDLKHDPKTNLNIKVLETADKNPLSIKVNDKFHKDSVASDGAESQMQDLEQFAEKNIKNERIFQNTPTDIPSPTQEPIENTEINLKEIEKRIQLAEKEKNEVELMLEKVKDSILGIDSLENYSKSYRKPNLKDKNEPVAKHEEAKKKSELTNQKLKLYREDQKRREIALTQELKKINKRIKKEQNLLKGQKTKEKEHRNEEYMAELEKMKEKKARRKTELEEIKKRQQELDNFKNMKPLYMRIEERYKTEIEKFEAKRYKESKNNQGFSPIRMMDIMDHAKWYDDIKNEHKKRVEREIQLRSMGDKTKSANNLASAWTMKTIEDDKRMKSELGRASQERLNLIEKKTRYADLVKELFKPTIDRLKKQENEDLGKNKGEQRCRSNSHRSPVNE